MYPLRTYLLFFFQVPHPIAIADPILHLPFISFSEMYLSAIVEELHVDKEKRKSPAVLASVNTVADCHQIWDSVYVGSMDAAVNRAHLKHLGITHVLNVTSDLKNYWPEDFQYNRISVADNPQVDVKRFFDEATEWISKAKGGGGAVLVHCMAGMSRSATIIIAYLMRFENKSLREAYDHAKKQRSVICPNAGFFRQLMDYELTLFGQSSFDLKKHMRERSGVLPVTNTLGSCPLSMFEATF